MGVRLMPQATPSRAERVELPPGYRVLNDGPGREVLDGPWPDEACPVFETVAEATAAAWEIHGGATPPNPPADAGEMERLRDALDGIQALITDAENKWGDPHTLRHAKADLETLRAALASGEVG